VISPPVASSTSTSTSTSPEDWDLIIRPHRKLFDLKLRELWRYRDLVMLFVRRDFVSLYKQTILGPLWYLIQPLLTTITFTIVFGNIAKLPTDGLPQFLFYMAGTTVWTYFATCLTKTADTFVANAGLFGKVYFPRLAVPVSVLISNLIAFAIQFVFFLAFMGYFALRGHPVHPSLYILLTPILLLIMAGLGLGFGLIVSAMTTKYRDLRFLVQFGVQLLMYATPVVYSISSIPARFRPLIQANPMTSVIEAFRYAYLGGGTVSLGGLAYSFAFMVVIVAVGAVIFNRVEATFMDTV
jgi:lipopolysaccharide transport system permease protein